MCVGDFCVLVYTDTSKIVIVMTNLTEIQKF